MGADLKELGKSALDEKGTPFQVRMAIILALGRMSSPATAKILSKCVRDCRDGGKDKDKDAGPDKEKLMNTARECLRAISYQPHLASGEYSIRSGLCKKKGGFSAKERMFILTNHKRLLYLDIEKSEQISEKGDILLKESVQIINKGAKDAFTVEVVAPKARKYDCICELGEAAEWCALLTKVKKTAGSILSEADFPLECPPSDFFEREEQALISA